MAPLLSLLVALMAAGLSHAGTWDFLKTDCGVSVWSAWGPTIKGYRTRTRKIFRYPFNGGAPCPPLTETDMDPWTMSVPFKASMIKSSLMSGIGLSSSGRKRRQSPTIRPRDFLFIVDMSGSITASQYQLAKNNMVTLIGEICGEIGLGRQQNRAAVITYSTNTVENFDFDFHTTTAAVQNAFRNLPRTTGLTCTGKALQYAESMFALSKGARPDGQSVKEVVLLTDGMANCPPPQILAAINLQNSRNPPITMFVFAIGTNFDKSQIDAMASNPVSSHLFTFDTYDDFSAVVADVVAFPAVCAPIVVG